WVVDLRDIPFIAGEVDGRARRIHRGPDHRLLRVIVDWRESATAWGRACRLRRSRAYPLARRQTDAKTEPRDEPHVPPQNLRSARKQTLVGPQRRSAPTVSGCALSQHISRIQARHIRRDLR